MPTERFFYGYPACLLHERVQRRKNGEGTFIPRNSLQYRMNKIQELIDFELDDYMEYLDMISCILIKQLMFS